MAMSLEQPLTVDAEPVEAEVAEDETAMHVTPSPSGEHAAELTPNVELAEPIGELTIDTDAETVVPSPSRLREKSLLEAGTSQPFNDLTPHSNCQYFSEPEGSPTN